MEANKIMNADIHQELKSRLELRVHFLKGLSLRLGELGAHEPVEVFLQSHLRNLLQRLAAHQDVRGEAFQASAFALGALEGAFEARQENADVHLVFFGLEVIEEADHAPELGIALPNQVALFFG